MEWNVYYYDSNSRKIKPFNIFKHGGFNQDVEKYLKKYKDKDEFAEHLKSSLMYFFWSRAEYELIIEITENNHIFLSPWCGCSEPEKAKIDVTNDKNFNWKDFAEEHIKKQVYKNKAKIDIYDQVMSNWGEFVDLCWNSKRRRKSKE